MFKSEMRDSEQFKTISAAMECIGILATDRLEIYKIVAAVIAFSNVGFIDSGDTRGMWTYCRG